MTVKRDARPHWQADGRARKNDLAVASGHTNCNTDEVALQIRKRGKVCTVGKLVVARPLGELVLAYAYRHRKEVEHPSVSPRVLSFARDRGVRLWVVRLDQRGECYAFPLSEVDKPSAGWQQTSDGTSEWFLPLERFGCLGWQDWNFVENTIRLDDEVPTATTPKEQQAERQLTLW